MTVNDKFVEVYDCKGKWFATLKRKDLTKKKQKLRWKLIFKALPKCLVNISLTIGAFIFVMLCILYITNTLQPQLLQYNLQTRILYMIGCIAILLKTIRIRWGIFRI